MNISNEEILRYSRHLILPEIGIEGQEKLKNAKVLVIGAGGNGSIALIYLASSGVGEIGIVDFDTVELSNLQRQVIHSTGDIGKKKTGSAIDSLTLLNPLVKVNTYDKRLTSENAFEIISGYDIVIDCSDNFPTAYLINDACIILNKPDVYGSVYQFEGKVSVFCTINGPCYRCLFSVPPPPELIPNCDEGGVLSVVPGIIGALQALEAIKLITGIGSSLIGKVLFFNALQMEFHNVTLNKNPECSMCNDTLAGKHLADYEEFCGINTNIVAASDDDEITAGLLNERITRGDDIFILDVRNKYEYDLVNIGGHLLPVDELKNRFRELDPSREIIVMCKTGSRSRRAVSLLKDNGFKNIKNLNGGIKAWIEQVDNSLPLY